MGKEINKLQSQEVNSFNKKYFESFEDKLNTFLKENYYKKSVASDPEPEVINRNRIMHGIFTRKISKVDCLKLFVTLDSMIRFNDWLECYRNMIHLIG